MTKCLPAPGTETLAPVRKSAQCGVARTRTAGLASQLAQSVAGSAHGINRVDDAGIVVAGRRNGVALGGS